MDRFFQKFPLAVYSNTNIVDLSRRVKIKDKDRRIPNMFYPVELSTGIRPDILADAYYDDPELDWLILMSNAIVDPFYGWYLSEDDFQKYILDKYGDYDMPRKTVYFWRNNWAGDTSEITPTQYENHISPDHKKYYSPNFGAGSKVLSYSRKKEDWTVNTNKIMSYDITYTSGNSFSNGEFLTFDHAGAVGNGVVISCNSTVVFVQHLQGNVTANSTWTKTLIGDISNTRATTTSSNVVVTNITSTEGAYWSPVTYYQFENERNEKKKHVVVLNPASVSSVSMEVRRKLNQ